MSWATYLDPTAYDYQIIAGKIVVTTGNDAVRNRLLVSLNILQGEWYLDTDDGLPYYDDDGILSGQMQYSEVSGLIRQIILKDPDVDSINSMTFTQDSRQERTFSIKANVKLTNSDDIPVET